MFHPLWSNMNDQSETFTPYLNGNSPLSNVPFCLRMTQAPLANSVYHQSMLLSAITQAPLVSAVQQTFTQHTALPNVCSPMDYTSLCGVSQATPQAYAYLGLKTSAAPSLTTSPISNHSDFGISVKVDGLCPLSEGHCCPSSADTESCVPPLLAGPFDRRSSVSSGEDHVTPENAFHQNRDERHSCQVCGELAVGFHHGAYVCEACKKFFMRHSNPAHPINSVCTTGGLCVIGKNSRGKCQSCRYQKCLLVGMKPRDRNSNTDFNIGLIPCRVCGCRSSGFHFGAVTCEGCKGFFRRTEPYADKLVCSGQNNCDINNRNRNMCKKCRFRKCTDWGMSKNGSRIGRQTNAVKFQCAREIDLLMHMQRTAFQLDDLDTEQFLTNGSNCKGRKRRSSDRTLSGDSSTTSSSLTPACSLAHRPRLEVGLESVLREALSQLSSWNRDLCCLPKELDMEMMLFRAGMEKAADTLYRPREVVRPAFVVLTIQADQVDSIEAVWGPMMNHFDMHSYVVVDFAKAIPGFNNLELKVKRRLVREAMYPLILLDLSRDYNVATNEYNYFDFDRREREIILHYFPTFDRIASHLRESGRTLKILNLDKTEMALLCCVEIAQNYHLLDTYLATMKLLFFAKKLLIDHVYDKHRNNQPETRCRIIFEEVCPMLARMNREHHDVIADLKITRSHLEFPELYIEMFQLSPVEEDIVEASTAPISNGISGVSASCGN